MSEGAVLLSAMAHISKLVSTGADDVTVESIKERDGQGAGAEVVSVTEVWLNCTPVDCNEDD